MLNFVSKADQEFEILAFRGVVPAKMLRQTLAKVPMLRFTIDVNVPISLWIFALLLVPRLPSLPIKDAMKESGPSNHDQDDKVRRSEPRARAAPLKR